MKQKVGCVSSQIRHLYKNLPSKIMSNVFYWKVTILIFFFYLKYILYVCGVAFEKELHHDKPVSQKVTRGNVGGRRSFSFFRGGTSAYVHSRSWLNPYRYFQFWIFPFFLFCSSPVRCDLDNKQFVVTTYLNKQC